jgi:hypothetical protein
MQDETTNGGEEVVEDKVPDPSDPEVFDSDVPTSPNAPNAPGAPTADETVDDDVADEEVDDEDKEDEED